MEEGEGEEEGEEGEGPFYSAEREREKGCEREEGGLYDNSQLNNRIILQIPIIPFSM